MWARRAGDGVGAVVRARDNDRAHAGIPERRVDMWEALHATFCREAKEAGDAGGAPDVARCSSGTASPRRAAARSSASITTSWRRADARSRISSRSRRRGPSGSQATGHIFGYIYGSLASTGRRICCIACVTVNSASGIPRASWCSASGPTTSAATTTAPRIPSSASEPSSWRSSRDFPAPACS